MFGVRPWTYNVIARAVTFKYYSKEWYFAGIHFFQSLTHSHELFSALFE